MGMVVCHLRPRGTVDHRRILRRTSGPLPPSSAVTALVEQVKAEAIRLGFLACGVAPLGPNLYADALDRWLKAGFGGTMTYLNRQAKKRKDTRVADAEARVAVVVLDRYHGGGDHHAAGPP